MNLARKFLLSLGFLALTVLIIGVYTQRTFDRARQEAKLAREGWEQMEPVFRLGRALRNYETLVSEAAVANPQSVNFQRIERAEQEIMAPLNELVSVVQAIELERGQEAPSDLGSTEQLVDLQRQLTEAAGLVLASRAASERQWRLENFMALAERMEVTLSGTIASADERMGNAMEVLSTLENRLDAAMKTWWWFFLGLLVVLHFVTRHFVVRPIRSLMAGVAALRERRFEHRVPVTSRDELGAVAESFNMMAEELNTLYQSLEEKVEEQAQRIRTTFAELEKSQKLASIGTLAAGVAHEINNPLEAMMLNVDGLNRRAKRSNSIGSEEMSDYLKDIEENLRRCQLVTSQLLEFSRQRLGKTSSDFEIVDIVPMLERTQDLIPPTHQGQQRKIVVHIPDRSLPMKANPHLLRQVFYNLMINAIEATKSGDEIRISAYRDEDEIHVCIGDDGIGITEEHLPHLFDPFYSTKGPGKNSGLGLSVVHGIIKSHGGRIIAESDGEGHGATFTITFPLAGSEQQ